jgi:hypothetical protein
MMFHGVIMFCYRNVRGMNDDLISIGFAERLVLSKAFLAEAGHAVQVVSNARLSPEENTGLF